MIAQSQSGTGKTAAFVLALLHRVDKTNMWPQVNVSSRRRLISGNLIGPDLIAHLRIGCADWRCHLRNGQIYT